MSPEVFGPSDKDHGAGPSLGQDLLVDSSMAHGAAQGVVTSRKSPVPPVAPVVQHLMENPLVNIEKMVEKCGKSRFYSWVNWVKPLFRLGHVQ